MQGARGYAAAAAEPSEVRVYGLAGRYAHALFNAASKKNALDAVDSELGLVQKMLKENPPFQYFVNDASLQRSDKASAVKGIMAKGSFSPLTTDFMGMFGEGTHGSFPLQLKCMVAIGQ